MATAREWFTNEEAAEYLRVSKRTIYKLSYDRLRLNLTKQKILKEDGRYLIYFTFEREAPPAGENETPAAMQDDSVVQPPSGKNGDQQ